MPRPAWHRLGAIGPWLQVIGHPRCASEGLALVIASVLAPGLWLLAAGGLGSRWIGSPGAMASAQRAARQ
eukprot:4020696-Lingulodinium_polyedra.AAC.1